jgi:hypothetical protein
MPDIIPPTIWGSPLVILIHDLHLRQLTVTCSNLISRRYIYETVNESLDPNNGVPVIHCNDETLDKMRELLEQNILYIIYDTTNIYENQTINQTLHDYIDDNTWFFGKIVDQETGEIFYKWSSPQSMIPSTLS